MQFIIKFFQMVYFIILKFLRVFQQYPIKNPGLYMIIITGCDSGIGLMLTEKLIKMNFLVVSVCLTEKGVQHLHTLQQQLDASYPNTSAKDPQTTSKHLNRGKVIPIQCDITKAKDVNSLYHQVEQILNQNKSWKLWALVNNAGIAPAGFTDWLSMDSFRKVMEVNYFAVVDLVKTFLPLLKRSKDSRIINLSSLAGIAGFHMGGAYCGSKHALEGFMKCLRLELLSWNIYVTNINPGFMSTPLISTSEAAGLREFESAPKDITSQYPIHNYTNLSSQIKQVEETPYIAVNAVIDQIYASIPLFNHYPGWQGQFVSWLFWASNRYMKHFIDLITNYPHGYGPYPEIVKEYQG